MHVFVLREFRTEYLLHERVFVILRENLAALFASLRFAPRIVGRTCCHNRRACLRYHTKCMVCMLSGLVHNTINLHLMC